MNDSPYLPSPILFWLLILTAVVGYILPWVVAIPGSLQLGGYDLAEFISLHPSSATTFPIMLPSLLLRLQLLVFVLLIAFYRPLHRWSGRWWLHLVVVLLLSIAQLPTIEFFTSEINNPNYQQQFVLAFISLLGGGVGLLEVIRSYRLSTIIVLLLLLIGIMSSILGSTQSVSMIVQFQIEITSGVGVFVVVGAYILFLGLMIVHFVKEKR